MGNTRKGGALGAWLRDNLLAVLLFAVLAVGAVWAVDGAAGASRSEQLRIAEQSVRRAAVSCYAIEGCYPESYAYLKEHYNVRIDERKFAVQYTVFGSNLMPEITVLEVGG